MPSENCASFERQGRIERMPAYSEIRYILSREEKITKARLVCELVGKIPTIDWYVRVEILTAFFFQKKNTYFLAREDGLGDRLFSNFCRPRNNSNTPGKIEFTIK